MKIAKLAIVTTSRADFGLLSPLIKAAYQAPELETLLYVTGLHLSAMQGRTADDVHARFSEAKIVEMTLDLSADVEFISKVGAGMREFALQFSADLPSGVILLGDRFEQIAPASAALALRIPVFHIHGGEVTNGAIDDAVRHALTKMSRLHFVSHPDYARRVIQMGEDPSSVFVCGAPGLEEILSSELLTKPELEQSLGFNLSDPWAIITLHSTTLGSEQEQRGYVDFIAALEKSPLSGIITQSNSDPGSKQISDALQDLCRRSPSRFHFVTSLGHLRYLSCLKHAALMLGNSSSGIIEAPSFHLPVVNVGSRQDGRIRGTNVIDTAFSEQSILSAISKALHPDFRKTVLASENPYLVKGTKPSEVILREVINFFSNSVSRKPPFNDS